MPAMPISNTIHPTNTLARCRQQRRRRDSSGHADKTKRDRVFCWIFLVIAFLGSLSTLVTQIISTVSDASNSSSSAE
jgi:hypothetical protein